MQSLRQNFFLMRNALDCSYRDRHLINKEKYYMHTHHLEKVKNKLSKLKLEVFYVSYDIKQPQNKSTVRRRDGCRRMERHKWAVEAEKKFKQGQSSAAWTQLKFSEGKPWSVDRYVAIEKSMRELYMVSFTWLINSHFMVSFYQLTFHSQ